eukprot:jgi/Botrbrau1/15283/Bobra.97_1s0009.2
MPAIEGGRGARAGVDDVDSYEELCNFISTVHQGSGVTHFIIHARKCLLKGLSPAENRTVPPLRHAWVFALKRDFPQLTFSLNGVVGSCHVARQVLDWREGGDGGVPILGGGGGGGLGVQGVMIGRAAYNTPWDCLSDADVAVFGASSNAAVSRRQVLEQYSVYGDSMVGRWGRRPDGAVQPGVRSIIIPILGMFHGQPGARRWRQAIDQELRTATSVSAVIQETMKCVPQHVLDAPPLSRPQDLPQYSPGPLPDPAPLPLRWQLEPPAGGAFPEPSPPPPAHINPPPSGQMAGRLPSLPAMGSGDGQAAEVRASANQSEGRDGTQQSCAVPGKGSREPGGAPGGPQGTLAADGGLQPPAGQAIIQGTRGGRAAGNGVAGTWVDDLMVSAGWLYKWIAGTANGGASRSEALRGSREGRP